MDLAHIHFGVLDFSYRNNTGFESLLHERGEYTVNLGDYIQSHAVHSALLALGVAPSQISMVDRDDLASCATENLFVIMNAVFYPVSFPLSKNIVPVYFGFSFHPDNIFPWDTRESYDAALGSLRPLGRIGCRDLATARMLAGKGFATYVSGCLSQSLERPMGINRSDKPILLCGLDNQALEDALVQASGSHILLRNQRKRVAEYPLSQQTMAACRADARSLLDLYGNHVSLAVTSLLHCAGPCAALGIPTVIARSDPDNLRFSDIAEALPVISSDSSPDLAILRSLARTMNRRTDMLTGLQRAIEEMVLAQGSCAGGG